MPSSTIARQNLSAILPDGSLYSGEMVPAGPNTNNNNNNIPHGNGIRHYLSNRLYVGEWNHGLMQGKGLLWTETGDIFEGFFERGQYHGRGILFVKNEMKTIKGNWKNGNILNSEEVSSSELAILDHNQQQQQQQQNVKSVLYFKQNQLEAVANSMKDLRFKITSNANNNNNNNPPASPLQKPNPLPPTLQFGKNTVNNASILNVISPEPFGNVPANAPVHDQVLSNQLLLTVSGPSYNFAFSFRRFFLFFSMYCFPFLSLPGITPCPLRVDAIDLEREYIVSGAALRADFELPTWEIYFASLSILFLVIAGGISSHLFTNATIRFETSFAWSDVIVPGVLIFIFALLQAAYQGYHRTAHALERLDRHHFPKLAALSRETIDSNCHTLVVSWDEEGLGRVMNKKFKYKWATIAIIYGFLLGFVPCFVRIIRGQNAFAADMSYYTEVSAILCFIAQFTVSSGITYQFWRILDLERQLDETMSVITRCAYLKGQSILRPSDNRKSKFHFDAPISMEETESGFLGWYIVRSFALYASTLANHRSRHAFVSIVALAIISIDGAIIADTFRSLQRDNIVFTTAHGFAVLAILGWGNLLLYFFHIANSINQEVRKHLYLADVAGMFHLFRDAQGANVIGRCRSMIAEHDYATKVLGIRVTDKYFAVALVFHGLAVGCMIVSVLMWIFQLTGYQSDLLKF